MARKPNKRKSTRRSPRKGGSKSSSNPNSSTPIHPVEQARQGDRFPYFPAARRAWELGAFERAADAFRQALESERDDPSFARYWLASSLFLADASDELTELLRKRDDSSGTWRFAQALHAFRVNGDTDDARRLLVEADYLLPGFEDYLLRDQIVDAGRALRFDAGADERAFACARLFLPAWRGVSGAVSWARHVLKVPPTPAESDLAPRRFPREELRLLPLRSDTWQVGLTGDDAPVDEETSLRLLGVANVDGQEIRRVTVIDRPLGEVAAFNELIQSILSPLHGEPALPETLVVCRREFADAWQPLLAEFGVRCEWEDVPEPIGGLLEAMQSSIKDRELPDAEDVDVGELPQSDAIWQAAFFRSPAWIMNEEQGSYRPWSVLVLDKSGPSALTTKHAPADPTPEMLLDILVRTMARHGGEAAQRPHAVEVADSDCYDYLRPRLEAVGVGCRLVDELSVLDDFCLHLARSMDGSEKCALADGRGVTNAHLESFYEAAEHFFRQAPWRRVPGEVPIEIRCDDSALGTRYAIIIGRTGVQLGLCIYDDWDAALAMLNGQAAADDMRALVVCYDEAEIMAAVDLQLIERRGWPIATPEAWPAVMRLQPGRTLRAPSAEELVLLDACLRALPDFVQSNATSQSRRVATGSRSVALHLQLNW